MLEVITLKLRDLLRQEAVARFPRRKNCKPFPFQRAEANSKENIPPNNINTARLTSYTEFRADCLICGMNDVLLVILLMLLSLFKAQYEFM